MWKRFETRKKIHPRGSTTNGGVDFYNDVQKGVTEQMCKSQVSMSAESHTQDFDLHIVESIV